MATPKTVTKIIKKDGDAEVTFTSDVDKAQYFLFELNRGALRDVSKFLKKKAQATFASEFRKRTGGALKATAINAKVWSSKNTKFPRLEIGLAEKGLRYWFFFQEIGTSKTPKKAILQNTVMENIDTIVKIESQYLSALESEAAQIESLIDESEYDD